MLITDKIPSYIYELLNSEGVDTNKIMLASYCDMNNDHISCDAYVISTEDKLIVISGYAMLEGGKGAGKLEKVWHEESYREYDVSDIEKLKLDELSSSARLTAKLTSGEYVFLTALTNTYRSALLSFIKYFERMKKGEISGVDFEEISF